MQNGQAVFTGGFTADHAQALRGLHLSGGTPGSSASPYFCLSDLAKHWPSKDRSARREVVMISDGVDPYYMEYDPDEPYLKAAIYDSVRAGTGRLLNLLGEPGHAAAAAAMKTTPARII